MKRMGKQIRLFNLDNKIVTRMKKDICSLNKNINIKFVGFLSIFDGKTFDEVDIPFVYVNDLSKSYLKSDFCDASLIAWTISVFHEIRHASLKIDHYSGVYESIQMNYVAKCKNPDYYIGNGNHTKNLIEIDAESYGILSANKYLCKEFSNVDPKQIEKLFVNYINNRIQQKGRFENVPYQIKDKTVKVNSMEDIEAAFDASIQAVLDNDPKYKKRYNVSRSLDEVACLLKQEEWSDIRDRMFTASNTEKDKIVASVNVFLHDEFKKEFPDLKPYSFEEIDGKYDIIDFRRKQAEMLEIGIQNSYDDSMKFE